MACPYFCPSIAATGKSQRGMGGPQNAMLPLGDSFAGDCCASPDIQFQPDSAVSRDLCNLGYARGSCNRFPDGEGPDAVRFTISADQGPSLRLYYVIERNHHPYSHGPLEYSLDGAFFSQPPATRSLDLQARAYIASYLRRKVEAKSR